MWTLTYTFMNRVSNLVLTFTSNSNTRHILLGTFEFTCLPGFSFNRRRSVNNLVSKWKFTYWFRWVLKRNFRCKSRFFTKVLLDKYLKYCPRLLPNKSSFALVRLLPSNLFILQKVLFTSSLLIDYYLVSLPLH